MTHDQFLPRSLDFVGLGQMKCGSTALWEYVLAHPDVYSAHYDERGIPVKESHFFTTDAQSLSNNGRVKVWRDCVLKAPESQLLGEYTVHNMDRRATLENIKQHSPDAKLFAVFRNPAERIYSQWNWLYNKNQTWEMEIETQLDRYMENLTAQSMYASQVKNVLELFDREQLMFIKYEDFKTNNEQTVKSLLQFLDLDLDKYEYKPLKATVKPYIEPLQEHTYKTISTYLKEEISQLETLLDWNCDDWR